MLTNEPEYSEFERQLNLGNDSAPIPERLLLAHAMGNVLFVTGAGISIPHPANLPDFKGLVLAVYRDLDAPTHDVLSEISAQQPVSESLRSKLGDLNVSQNAEVWRFHQGDYDVVLGMLERRLDGSSNSENKVRNAVRKALRENDHKPAQIHRSLIRLADSGSTRAIITTNFDLLLEDAAKSIKSSIQTYTLGGIPRPSRNSEFSGVMHIHGALDRKPNRTTDLILTDRDQGEFYLRRRIVPDLIYDAARLFNLVLVGYSANDPPMRYLLNAVAADRERYSDLKERFVFIGCHDFNPVELEDWRSRGLTPIPYTTRNGAHDELSYTLQRWAELSTSSSNKRRVHSLVKRLTKTVRRKTIQNDRELFDHFIRRSHSAERNQICLLLSSQKVDTEWLDALTDVVLENVAVPEPDLSSGIWEARNNEAVNLVISFLRGRFEETKVLKWAIESNKNININRPAIRLLLQIDGPTLSEPWLTAWRLIEESWRNPLVDQTDLYHVSDRLEAGERTSAVIRAISDLVEPGISINPNFSPGSTRRKYKTLHDLIEVSLTSGELLNPSELGLSNLTANDKDFMVALANALDAAVIKGVEIGQYAGWKGDDHLWLLGGLSLVEYDKTVQDFNMDEPDVLNRGIAPSVKLLHEVVSMLAKVDFNAANKFVLRWKTRENPVHLRLWASFSNNPQITPAKVVGQVLLNLNKREFWLNEDYPEIAAMRANRFSEFDDKMKVVVATRIRKGPPLELWPPRFRSTIKRQDRIVYSIQELKRIQSKGGELPHNVNSWMESICVEFPELSEIAPTEPARQRATMIAYELPSSDSRFSGLVGIERLRALEESLSPFGGGRGNGAAAWIKQSGNTLLILGELESLEREEANFPRVWEHFGWSHTPMTEKGELDTNRDLSSEANRVIELLSVLSKANLMSASKGIVNWLDTWREIVVKDPSWAEVWCRIWPIVQENTNSDSELTETTIRRYTSNADWLDLDTLNKPEGRLIEVFLAACQFSINHKLRYLDQTHLLTVRDEIVKTSGKSRSIAIIRLTIGIDFFLKADPVWTKEHLILPLRGDSGETLALWQMIGRQLRSSRLLKFVGQEMINRTRDSRLDKQTRRNLAHNVISESLHAFLNDRSAAVDNNRVQQMIRNLDDETRVYCAIQVSRFLVNRSKENDQNPDLPRAVIVFQTAIVPFIKYIWPKEKSLATPGVSKGLANLPVYAQEAFAEAVEVIDHLLVPFDCRSLYVYGLRSTNDKDRFEFLRRIDDENKAKALLRLLDRTIGTAETSYYPYELGDALDQISSIAPSLNGSQEFKRLSTLARR